MYDSLVFFFGGGVVSSLKFKNDGFYKPKYGKHQGSCHHDITIQNMLFNGSTSNHLHHQVPSQQLTGNTFKRKRYLELEDNFLGGHGMLSATSFFNCLFVFLVSGVPPLVNEQVTFLPLLGCFILVAVY